MGDALFVRESSSIRFEMTTDAEAPDGVRLGPEFDGNPDVRAFGRCDLLGHFRHMAGVEHLVVC